MQCPSCNKPVESEWKSCPWCEGKLAVPCGSCDKPLQTGWKRCPFCDTQVSQGSASPSATASLLGYCAGTGKAIKPEDPHFKCLECGKLYLESQRFEDKPICQPCAYESGMAQTVEKARAEQAKIEAERRASEAKVRAAREASECTAREKVEAAARARAEEERKSRKKAEQQAKEDAEKCRREQLKLGITDADWSDIPAGKFMMGSPESEEGRNDNERLHHVEVSAFRILKTPVTFAMFDVFCEATGRKKPGDEGWGRANRPVINVRYWDAVDYCEWLSKESEWSVRLPTEAEWEYACRAGTTTPFWMGNRISTDQANYANHGGSGGINRGKSTPVDMFRPNPWGLYDMHGNVWELCASQFNESYDGMESRDASEDRSNQPLGVMRGGSWAAYLTKDLRSASRAINPHGGIIIGFRLVQVL